MNLLNILKDVISPVTKLIDDLHTSDEEKMQLQAEVFKMQTMIATKAMEYEAKMVEAQSATIQAEAKGESWLQRNWRPITMLTFVTIIVMRMFGLTDNSVTEQEYVKLWELMAIGLGGYVVGRSAEKIVPKVAGMLKK